MSIIILWTSVHETLPYALRLRDPDLIDQVLARAFSLNATINAWRKPSNAVPEQEDDPRFRMVVGWECVYHDLKRIIPLNDAGMTEGLMGMVAALHRSMCEVARLHGLSLDAHAGEQG